MTEAALSLAFFDPAHALHGMVRSGFTLLFDGGRASPMAEGSRLQASRDGYRAVLEGRFELAFTPLSDGATMDGATTRVCSVTGAVGDEQISCLGTATETDVPPAWAELDAVRAVSAILDAEHAVLVLARRERGAPGHGAELVRAHMLSGGEMVTAEDARISTVYDGDGRQRSAGIELWLPGEDFPRRAAGSVAAGTSLELEGLRVNAAVFEWHMEGREGAGAYELTVRSGPLEAA